MSERLDGPLTPDAERELMLRLGRGEEDAVRTLYLRFARPVYTLGLRMLGSREAAEELTQDVFLTAWRKAGRYDPARGRLSTWLMAVAHNLAVDRLRRWDGRSASFAALDEVAGSAVGAVSEEDALLDRESARRILAGLSSGERRLLALAYFRGWTAREIAQADGIPLGTVKTRLRAVLIRLRKDHAEKEW